MKQKKGGNKISLFTRVLKKKVIIPKFFQIIFDKLFLFEKIVDMEGVIFIHDLRALVRHAPPPPKRGA